MFPQTDKDSFFKMFRGSNVQALPTSDQDGGGFFGGIPNVVGPHTAVDTTVVNSNSRNGQRAPFDHAPSGELLPIGSHPFQTGMRVSARCHTDQSDRLAGVHHQGVVQEELDRWRSCRRRWKGWK